MAPGIQCANYFSTVLLVVSITYGCAVTSPIQPAASSKSGFDGAVYKGETVTTGIATPGNEAYRVFIQGATGFVSIGAVRDDAEQRAKEFCGRKTKSMHSLSETTAKPPYLLGDSESTFAIALLMLTLRDPAQLGVGVVPSVQDSGRAAIARALIAWARSHSGSARKASNIASRTPESLSTVA